MQTALTCVMFLLHLFYVILVWWIQPYSHLLFYDFLFLVYDVGFGFTTYSSCDIFSPSGSAALAVGWVIKCKIRMHVIVMHDRNFLSTFLLHHLCQYVWWKQMMLMLLYHHPWNFSLCHCLMDLLLHRLVFQSSPFLL